MTIDNKYDLGDMVYLSTDPDQRERIIIGIIITPSDILYKLACGLEDTNHYAMEITKEKIVA